jgi:hypothetical protein
MIEGLRQSQIAAEEARMRHEGEMEERRTERKERQAQSAFDREMREKEFERTGVEGERKARMETARMVAPFMERYNSEYARIMADPKLTPQQKVVAVGRLRTGVAQTMRLLAPDMNVDDLLGPAPTPEALEREARGGPMAYDPEATKGVLGGIAEAPTGAAALTFAQTAPPEADPEQTARGILTRFGPGGKSAGEIAQYPGGPEGLVGRFRSPHFEQAGYTPQQRLQHILKLAGEKRTERQSGNIFQRAGGYLEDVLPDLGVTTLLQRAWRGRGPRGAGGGGY